MCTRNFHVVTHSKNLGHVSKIPRGWVGAFAVAGFRANLAL
jgi:hypothetical protein